MAKSIYQIAIVGSALVTSALVEAALPIWIADQMSTADHIMTSREYGSLEAWRNCMADGWHSGDTVNGDILYGQCNMRIAAYQRGALEVKNVKLDDGGFCRAQQTKNVRSFSGRISNPTADVYLTNYSWAATYPAADEPVVGGTHIQNQMLAPGENKNMCLFTLEFENAADARRYDTNPEQLTIAVNYERGVVDKR